MQTKQQSSILKTLKSVLVTPNSSRRMIIIALYFQTTIIFQISVNRTIAIFLMSKLDFIQGHLKKKSLEVDQINSKFQFNP